MMDVQQSFGRKAPRAFRREQLIEATISTLARRGLADTTLSDVARAAGVSHGLINFHFQSKERLLAETLSFLSEEHRANWTSALAAAGSDPVLRLNALITAEFDETYLTADRTSAWVVFWGESQSMPRYLDQCGENDRAQIRAFEEACKALAEDGGYAIDPALAARMLRLTIEGVLLELMFSAQPYSIAEARRTAFYCASMLFPRHFTPDGLINR